MQVPGAEHPRRRPRARAESRRHVGAGEPGVEHTGEDGVAGAVGRLKRDGDGLPGDLFPHPDVKQVTRIFPDRYVVEIFIPAKAMNGFDPKHEPTLAFNIHAKNFQHAIDYFWSAPKEVMTQLRPSTWGNLYLQPAGAQQPSGDAQASVPVIRE
jgi:hypothetical protein